jgi:hypothetical protein
MAKLSVNEKLDSTVIGPTFRDWTCLSHGGHPGKHGGLVIRGVSNG